VDVCFDTADRVEIGSASLDDLICLVCVKFRLHFCVDHWQAVFGVPGNVEIDLGIDTN